MVVIEIGAAITDWVVGRLADAGIEAVRNRLADHNARRELTAVVGASVQILLSLVPSLETDEIAEDFAKEVVAPALLTAVCDPTIPVPTQEIVDKFIGRFVAPLRRGRSLDTTLTEAFELDAATLNAAVEEFFRTLRSGLYKSKHWKEAIRDATLEETRNDVRAIAEHLGISASPNLFSAAAAQRDAGNASQGLLSWPRTIDGEIISRPEFDQLLERVHSAPNGRTLVIGDAGSGKSALLSSLAAKLIEQGKAVVAIKADLLPETVRDIRDVSHALGLVGNIEAELDSLVRLGPLVVIIDQLDAVSEVMDRSSQRMRLLLQLANRYHMQDREADGSVKAHVIVSSRPFEAKHDARFRSLDAETIELALPTFEEVERLLVHLKIPPTLVPESMKATLRRPFALKLFVELVRRGEAVETLTPAKLLSAWLQSADLGNEQSRIRVLEYLEKLSTDMTATETLWRPVDVYEAATPQAVRLSEACGITIRSGSRVGFSHQAWLDDFQARRFASGSDLAAFAHERQDGLFARATILRGLERLRSFDEPSYIKAIDALLGSTDIRRHLKHLVMDLIATQSAPFSREGGWVAWAIIEDAPLARRALPKAISHWESWRVYVEPLLPAVMANSELRWTAGQILTSIAASEPDSVIDLIERNWSSPSDDENAVRVLWRAGIWNDRARDRLRTVFARSKVDQFIPAAYAEELLKKGNAVAAAEVVCLHVKSLTIDEEKNGHYYGVEKIAAAAPLVFATELLPWLLEQLREGVVPNTSLRNIYPKTHRLPYDWETSDGSGSIFPNIRNSLFAVAKSDPEKFVALIEPYLGVEVDEVQALIAEGLLAGGKALAHGAKDFLLGDARRLMVGSAHVDDVDGVGHTVQGWSSQMLLSGIASFLTQADLISIRDAIENWTPYRPEAWSSLDYPSRLARLKWSDEARLELLEKLPGSVLSSRRRRQVEEWRRDQPVLGTASRGKMRLSAIGSPMSAGQMAKASDQDIMGMLDMASDGTRRRESRRGWPFVGGASELATAFAAFGKENPTRAIALVLNRFEAGKHERAAGDLVRELSGLQSVEPQVLLSLIHTLSKRGFRSESWRYNASWALDAVAQRLSGLSDSDIDLLESWIETDPEVIFQQIIRHLDHKRHTLERDTSKEAERIQPVLFGYGGLTVLPHDNFVPLSAIFSSLISRKPPDCDGWLATLQRHLAFPEDPAIWSALLALRGRSLYWANRARTHEFFEALWKVCPLAFFDITIGHDLWRYRAMMPVAVRVKMLESWLSSLEKKDRQAAGEFMSASALVDPEDKVMATMMSSTLEAADDAGKIGCLFGAALVWRDNTGSIRASAHKILVRYAGTAKGAEAQAIAAALDLRRSKTIDANLRELLDIAASNKCLLASALTGSFLDEIQSLLLYPGFDETVLNICEASANQVLESRSAGMVEDNLVAISIALQRCSDPIRLRAMNLYERLLDVDFHGAEQAALASLRR